MSKEKRYPSYNDIVAWYVFHRLDDAPPTIGPNDIKAWIDDMSFSAANRDAVEKMLYEQYEEYREEFFEPTYLYYLIHGES